MIRAFALIALTGLAAAQSPRDPNLDSIKLDAECSMCPTAPSVQQPLHQQQPLRATFFTFRKSPQSPPLRTTRQTFNRKFIILHSLGAVAMIVACKRKGSGEDFGSEAIVPVAAVAGDYVMSRFFTEAMSVEWPVWEVIHYSHSASK